MNAPRSISPLPMLLLLLSASTGMVDAISVLGLGKVFTANMTGNIVFLGFAAAGLQGFQALSYIAAILAFIFGAAIGGAIGKRCAGRPLRQWLMAAAMIEAALLWIAGIVAATCQVTPAAPNAPVYAIIVLTAVAMGSRNATVRQLKVPDLTTTVLTLTITGLAADSSVVGGSNPNLGRRITAIFMIFAGAAIGALMVARVGLAPPLFVAGAFVLLGTIVYAISPSSSQPA